MFETKYSKFLTILLIVIIVAIIGLASYLGYTYYRNYSIDNSSNQYVSTFIEEVANNTEQNNGTTQTNTNETTGSISENIAAANTTTSNGSNKVRTYKGYNVIGTIEIPKTDIKYPVLQEMTPKALNTAVSKLYGPRTKWSWKYSNNRA